MFDDTSANIVAGLRASNPSKKMLDDLLKRARNLKPPGLDTATSKLRRYYHGHQKEDLKRVLAEQYPRTHARMTPVVLNIVRHLAVQQAAVYREPPDRAIVDENGEPLEDTDERARDLSRSLRRSNLDRLMPEAERRTVTAKTGLLMADVDMGDPSIGRAPSVRYRHHWPSDFWVIPHPQFPTSLQAALAVLIKVAPPVEDDSGAEWFQVWTQEVSEDDDGVPVFGQRYVELMSSDGRSLYPFGSESALWPLRRFPGVLLHDGVPEGIFLEVDTDAITVQDAVNSAITDALFTDKMQAHGELVYSGDQYGVSDFTGGPGQVIQIGPGEQMNALDYGDGNNARFAHVELLIKQHAVLNRVSPDTFSSEGPDAESGIARVIKNIPQTEARAERVACYAQVEERELLPIHVEISDYWCGTNIGPAEFRVLFQPPKDYEDPLSKQQRALEAMKFGLISPARAAVESDYFKNVDEAIERGQLSDVPVYLGTKSALADATSIRSNGPDDDGGDFDDVAGD